MAAIRFKIQRKSGVSRQHPIKLFSYTTRNFWLLLIPLARSVYALRFDLSRFSLWLKGAWLDIIVLFAIFAFAVIRYLSVFYKYDDEKLIIKKGIIADAFDTLFYCEIATLTVYQNLFFKIIGAAKVSVTTNAGTFSNTDITLITGAKQANRLFETVRLRSKADLTYSVSPRRLHLFFFSLIFSSTLSGVIIFSTLIIQVGKIIGNNLEKILFVFFNEVAMSLAVGIPPVAIGIAVVVGGGWLISFVANLLRYWRFIVSRRNNSIVIRSGILTRCSHFLNTGKINYIDLRQNFFTKIFRISSLHTHCAGYGGKGRELAVILPITTRHEINDTSHMLFPSYPQPKITQKPPLRNIMGYILAPLVASLVIPAAVFPLLYFFPSWRTAVIYSALIFEVPIVWEIIVQFMAFFTTGIGYENGFLTLKYCGLYSFHNIVMPVEKITKVTVYQSVFQYFSGNCHIKVYSQSDKTKSHYIKNMPLSETLEFFDKIGIDLYFNENPHTERNL